MTTALDRRLEVIREEEAKVLSRIDKRNKKRTIPCKACDTPHEIRDLTLIQTHFYVPPSGCTEGAYWLPGEIQFVCPQTDITNRMLFDNNDVPWDKRREYENNPQEQFKRIYGHLFKEIVEVHDDRPIRAHVNNFYVDEHREEFGLVLKRKKSD